MLLAAARRRLGAVPCRRRGAQSSAQQGVEAAAQPLLDWLASRGADTAGVRVTNSGDGTGWGLAAARECAAGDLLVSLPPSCTLSYSSDSLAPPLRRLVDAVPPDLWAARLGLVLLSERARGASSPFAPYIALLPSRFDGVPLFFSQEAVSALQYPPVAEQVKRRSRFLLSFASGPLASEQRGAAAESAFGGTSVDANALGWALASVSSRAFRLRGPSQPASLLPLVDMCNHSFRPSCEVKLGGPGHAVLVAKQRIAPGDQLLICYGQSLNNDLLLLDYGFVEQSSTGDTCALRFSGGLVELAREVAGLGHIPFGASSYDTAPGDGVAAQAWQEAILAELGLVGPGANLEVLIGGPDAVDPRLLAALRVLYVQDSKQLSRMSPALAAKALLLATPSSDAVDPTVERCALATAAGVCAVTLSQWPTTLAQDDVLLGSPKGAALAPDVRLAIQFRAEKKRCLATALAKLKARLG